MQIFVSTTINPNLRIQFFCFFVLNACKARGRGEWKERGSTHTAVMMNGEVSDCEEMTLYPLLTTRLTTGRREERRGRHTKARVTHYYKLRIRTRTGGQDRWLRNVQHVVRGGRSLIGRKGDHVIQQCFCILNQ